MKSPRLFCDFLILFIENFYKIIEKNSAVKNFLLL